MHALQNVCQAHERNTVSLWVFSPKHLPRKGLHLDFTFAIQSIIGVIGQQFDLLAGNSSLFTSRKQQFVVHAGNSTPAQMQPCAVFRQQHAKSVMIVKLTSTDIMSAGNDGRICRYHWQGQGHSNAVQPQTSQR